MSSSSESHGTHDLNGPTKDTSDVVARLERVLASQQERPAATEQLMRDCLALISSLVAGNERLRETNRDLHRRAQSHESEQAAFLRETGYHEQKRVADMWSAQWKSEFDRLMRGHQQMKLVYEVCAKALGLPYGRYHSVMDHPVGRPGDGKIYANVFLPEGGAESFEIVETVQKLAALSLDTNKGDGTAPASIGGGNG